jgi:nucleotide-binding universal stress UspA family protein
MPKKILCATDGTEHGNKSVEQASELAAATGASLTICTVNQMMGGVKSPLFAKLDGTKISTILEAAANIARAKGVNDVKEIELDSRNVSEAIVAYASQNGFDHIFTGTGDKRGISRVFLGSVATNVASTAHCPVTIAR